MVVYFLIDQVGSSFERQELENLKKNFKKVVLITTDKNSLVWQNENVVVELINTGSYKTSAYICKSIKYLPQFAAEFFRNSRHFSHLKLYFINISLFLRSIHLAENIGRIVQKHGGREEKAVLYSFWFNHWANAIGFLRKEQSGNRQFITRAHGTDLYEERVVALKRIAFRNFYLANLDKVFSVSQKGTDYLKNKYPAYSGKIFTSYLGTKDFGESQVKENSVFTLVTCARIRAIKRLHLLPQILMLIKNKIRWIHIGDEAKNDPYVQLFHDNLEKLKQNNPVVEIEFKGDLSNEAVFELYKTESINLFVSVSENEGLPVSMMEAISAGIPILSTDVGGCREIVNESTGILIEKDFDPKSVAACIDSFIESGMGKLSDRKNIRAFWKSHFENDENNRQFLECVGVSTQS